MRSVLVVGAGIAGLAVAGLLSRRGFDVTVIEKAEAPAPEGAGIQVSPNAAHVLNLLGVSEAVRNLARAPDRIELIDGPAERLLTTFDLGAAIERRYGAPYLVMQRRALRDVLAEAVGANVQLRYGTTLNGFEPASDGVHACIDGSDRKFYVLIGADGVGSAVRRSTDAASAAEETGWTAWRRTRSGEWPNVTRVTLFPNEHRVAYSLPAGLNEVWIREGRAPPPPGPGWTPWPVLTVPTNAPWSHGTSVLIGDAAHAMPPYAAQGGAMALEDAAVLAAALAQFEPAEAIAHYERKRRPRINAIAAMTEANRRIYHHAGAMRFARNAVMRTIPQRFVQRRMAWVYGWRPPGVRLS